MRRIWRGGRPLNLYAMTFEADSCACFKEREEEVL